MSSQNESIYLSFLLDDDELKEKIKKAVDGYISKNINTIIEKEINKKIDIYIEKFFDKNIPSYSIYTVDGKNAGKITVNELIYKKVKESISRIITDEMIASTINKVAKELSDKVNTEENE